jgi:hypothetical protein
MDVVKYVHQQRGGHGPGQPREKEMALREINNAALDGLHIKSYATEKNLRKRLAEDMDMYPDYNDRLIVVRTPAGRWTALVMLDKSQGGYAGRYEGFMKV